MIQSIDDVPLLIRREIEAAIIAPFVDSLSQRFPREQVLQVLRETIVSIARRQSSMMPQKSGGSDLQSFQTLTQKWTQGGALELKVLQQTPQAYDFNVMRCRYAEMYERLGIPELGAILSCSRDFAASEGFNPDLQLTRTQTILGGANHCDFRYRLDTAPPQG
jgi:hypothetical protein